MLNENKNREVFTKAGYFLPVNPPILNVRPTFMELLKKPSSIVLAGTLLAVTIGLGALLLDSSNNNLTPATNQLPTITNFIPEGSITVEGWSNWATPLVFTGEQVIDSNGMPSVSGDWIAGVVQDGLVSSEFNKNMGEFTGLVYHPTGRVRQNAEGVTEQFVNIERWKVEEAGPATNLNNSQMEQSQLLKAIDTTGQLNGRPAVIGITRQNPQAVRDEIEHNMLVIDRIIDRKR